MRGSLRGKDQIGVSVGTVVNKYKMRKHFAPKINEASFSFSLRESAVAKETALDGRGLQRQDLAACTRTEGQEYWSRCSLA